MFQRIHEKLGTAGFIIAIIALIAALSGGAYAASRGLNGKQKKEVEKIAKKFAGKPGVNGTNGANGSPGAKGDKGDQGAQGNPGATGPTGATGPAGAPGAKGASVTGTPIAKGGECGEQEGVKYTLSGTSTPICNGETGFTEILPSDKTETGTWGINFVSTVGGFFPGAYESISFPIPLAQGGLGFVFNESETELGNFGTSGCAGTAEAPTAPPGVLCVYTLSSSEQKEKLSSTPLTTRSPSLGLEEFGPSGAYLAGPSPESPTAAEPTIFEARGTWAVTAP